VSSRIVRRLFHEGEAAVASGDEEEFDGVAECGELLGGEAEVHFEADKVGVRSEERAREAAEVVLAGGEENVRSSEGVGVAGAGDGDAPELAGAMEGFGGVAAEDKCVRGSGALEESFVECAAREGLRGEGEGCGGDAERAAEADVVNGHGAGAGWERLKVEAETREAGEGFGGEKVAADFVVRAEGALEESDTAAGERELDGSGRAGGAAAEDDRIEIGGGRHRTKYRGLSASDGFAVLRSR
jgi:hypothetical protein